MKRSVAGLFTKLRLDDILNPVLEYPKNRHRYQVLVYHKVSPDPHPFFQPTPPGEFERQVLFLKEHYRVMDLEELVDRSARGSIPRNAVAITFDDGYRDNYDFAFPILRKHGIPATIFLTTSALDNQQKLWHDHVFDSFRFATKRDPSLTLEDVIRRAKGMRAQERSGYVMKVTDMLAPEIPEPFKAPMLSWNQVIEMKKSGIAFGSHTCTHPILAREKQTDVIRELVESRSEIRERTGNDALLLAYPNGLKNDFSDEVVEAARKTGYKCAFTMITGPNSTGTHPYKLKRGQPWQTDPSIFRFVFFLQRHFG